MKKLLRIEEWVLLTTLILFVTTIFSHGNRPPNIVMVFVDDLGWSDLGCYGNDLIDTPHIDQLSADGMRFTDAYATAICAPTRAALHTGQYPARLDYTYVPNPHTRPWALLTPPKIRWAIPSEVETLAEALKPAGYVSGTFGKWHLGYRSPHLPKDQGYVSPRDEDLDRSYSDELQAFIEANPEKGVGRNVRNGVRFIEQYRDHPFLCILSLSQPHSVPEARQELVEKYVQRFRERRTIIHPTYAAMVEVIDDVVGLTSRVLEDLGLADNTLLMFYSDNGGVICNRDLTVMFSADETLPRPCYDHFTTNWPLRAQKGTLYEGGTRVPLIVRWPGKVEAGAVCETPVHSVDFLPTFLELAGWEESREQVTDGVSFLPLLRQTGDIHREALYWHLPFYGWLAPSSSVRMGDYKLIHFWEDNRDELYHLKEDIGEHVDLNAQRPELVLQMRSKLDSWLVEMDAGIPQPNPNYSPQKYMSWGDRKPREYMANTSDDLSAVAY